MHGTTNIKCLNVKGDYVEKQVKVCDKTCIFFFFPIINKLFLMAKRSLLSRCPSCIKQASLNFSLIQQITQKFSTRKLLIQNDIENKCVGLTNLQLHQLIKQSETFLSNDPRRNCFAPLSRDATNFKNGYRIKNSYSALHYTKTDTLTAM